MRPSGENIVAAESYIWAGCTGRPFWLRYLKTTLPFPRSLRLIRVGRLDRDRIERVGLIGGQRPGKHRAGWRAAMQDLDGRTHNLSKRSATIAPKRSARYAIE